MNKKFKINGNKKQSGKPKAKPAPGPLARPRGGGGLDNQAKAYKTLLADPCNGPLVHPVYAGCEQGVLMRFTSYVNVNGGGGGNTCGAYLWNPGALSGLAFYAPAPTNSTNWNANNGGVPGLTFLSANNVKFRVVAACLEAMTDSSEMNRQGRFGFSNTVDGLHTAGTAATAAGMMATQSNIVRTPSAQLGIRWLPMANNGDWGHTGATTGAGGDGVDGSSLMFTWAGHQTDVGITLKHTCVYEVMFQDLGIPQVIDNNPSKNTLDDVLRQFWNENSSTIIATGLALGRKAVEYGASALIAL